MIKIIEKDVLKQDISFIGFNINKELVENLQDSLYKCALILDVACEDIYNPYDAYKEMVRSLDMFGIKYGDPRRVPLLSLGEFLFKKYEDAPVCLCSVEKGVDFEITINAHAYNYDTEYDSNGRVQYRKRSRRIILPKYADKNDRNIIKFYKKYGIDLPE